MEIGKKQARRRKEKGGKAGSKGIYDEAKRRGRCNTWLVQVNGEGSRRLASHGPRSRLTARENAGLAGPLALVLMRSGLESGVAGRTNLQVPYHLAVWGRVTGRAGKRRTQDAGRRPQDTGRRYAGTRQRAEGNMNREPDPGDLSLSLSVCDVRPRPQTQVWCRGCGRGCGRGQDVGEVRRFGCVRRKRSKDGGREARAGERNETRRSEPRPCDLL